MSENYFTFPVSSSLVKQLYETKDKKEKIEILKEIKNRWSNLKDKNEMKKCLRMKKKIEQLDKILKIV